MKIFRIFAILLPLAASSLFAAADPQLLSLLMPDAKAIAGVQLDQAKTSPFGQFILLQFGSNSDLDKMKAAIGFDPRTDLSEVVVGATASGKGLIAGHGTFQPARISILATIAGAKIESYRGIDLLGNQTATEDQAVAFLNGSTVVLGDRANVKSAVDRWIGAVRSTGGLVAKATEISASAQAWAVVTGLAELAGTQIPNAPPQAAAIQNLLSSVELVSGGLTFGDSNVTVRGQASTRAASDAQALADVLRFVIAMATPQVPLANAAQFDAQGSAVNFTLTLTEKQVEDLLKPQSASAPRTAARR